ncbi:TonB-dependent receptor [Edaphobacter bradus]|uniref:TonB-dependent receptor n=1 Tax=Edaphobacter bradus TaxID=2259016 RepID=UPI0021DF7AFD|nr:carboxypeptidase-like regulatory domain-containing protein [Edaphobacter bradus]
MFSSSAWAQTQSGLSTIQGTVADSMGAVIRNAVIQVVNKATGVASSTKSNETGFYQVPGLITGTYDLTVTAPGMKTYIYTVELQTAQTAVVNSVMTAGAVTQKVEVSATIVQLTDTDSGAITSVLERERIDQLPMNGRVITSLTQETTPGLENGFGPGTRANGLAGEALEYVADGAPLDNRNFGGPNASTHSQYPDPDAIQEVKVEVSGGGAEYATPATGIITTKSGTNQLHGTAFWTGANNSVAGIAKARQNPANFAAPNYKRNEFGVSAGGPVVVPGLYNGKDKTFWFFAFERYSLIQTVNQLYSVDTPAMKGGDFSGLTKTQLYDPSTTTANPACPTPGVVNGVTIWNAGPTVNNPYCRMPFGNGIQGDPGNNKIPLSRLNPVAKIIYDMTPAPTNASVLNPSSSAPNYNWAGPNLYSIPTITWRLDHNFNESNKAYLRYTSSMQSSQYPAGVATTIAADGIPAMAASAETILPVPNFAAALGYTHIFSPSFFSETVVSQQWFGQFVTATGDPHHNYEQPLGLPNNFGESGFPTIGGFVMPHGGNQFDYGISQIISNIDENLTKTAGKHQLHFGVRYRHERLGYQPDLGSDQNTADNLSTALYDPKTGGNYGALANSGASAADAFLGSMYNFTAGILPPYTHFSDNEFDAYIQDNYRVSKNLTLNIGLRWEDHPAQNTGGFGLAFDLPNKAIVMENTPSYYVSKGITTQAIITNMQNLGVKFETPSAAGYSGGHLLRSYPFNFAPRAGFAWQPFGDKRGTVVRGSYGRYIFPEALRNLLTTRNLPFYNVYGYNNNSAAQNPDSTPNYELRHPQNVFLGQNTANIVASSGINSILPGVGGNYFNHDFPPSIVTETNFTIEQAFKDNSALRVTWNWTHASNLTHGYWPNGSLSPFVWEYDTGTLPPNGGRSTIGTNQYAGTALNPYDNITYGQIEMLNRDGWSNDNSLQVNYQRLFNHGIAYQVIYVWSRPFRVGSNSTRESLGFPLASYPGVLGTASGATYAPLAGEGPMTTPAAPPAPPAGTPSWAEYHSLLRFEDYKVDPYFSGLFHHVTITGLVDLPVGRGKRLLGNSNRFVDEIVGGWQIAGDAQVQSQNFSPATTNWGQASKLVTYKHSVPITDCSSGKCFNRFMWFNGYISPQFLPPANGGICTTNCVTGLPSTYQPYMTPINNNPNIAANFGTNNVALRVPTLNGGQPVTVPFLPTTSSLPPQYAGNHPFGHSVLNGPFNYIVDLSLFKVFPITEKVNFRVNLDAFNVFNIQGYNNPNTTSGEESVSSGGIDGSSYWSPRQLQLTMRFTF